MEKPDIFFRHEVNENDIPAIGKILSLTGFFYQEEIDIALELALDSLKYRNESSYHFIMADIKGRLAGYTCYGEIPCTFGSYDLYWIAVHPDFQRMGIGEKLLDETEKTALSMGCRRMYIETSARQLYEPTQKFYTNCRYEQEAFLKDYYNPGDGKLIYVKALRDG